MRTPATNLSLHAEIARRNDRTLAKENIHASTTTW